MSKTGYALALYCGITFAGLKPASLFWLKDEHGEDIAYYTALFSVRGFRFVTLKRAEGRRLLYVFHRDRLEKLLADLENYELLASLGYCDLSLRGALLKLKTRIASGKKFPHEVGVFLGYPSEDVRGFIKDVRGGRCLDCGYWKVYGCEKSRARLFERYNRCSRCIMSKLEQGRPLERIFNLNVSAAKIPS